MPSVPGRRATAYHVVLASRSPARLTSLQHAGIDPQVIVSGADESRVGGETAAELTSRLAELKGESVLARIRIDGPTVVLSCDSVLDLDGRILGKPHTEEAARQWWYRLRGRSGVLVTGHHVIVLDERSVRRATRVGSTTVTFADLTDDEIAAYAATGEPQRVAGAFTLDGLGGPFITRIVGDPHNVTGLSLPLLRQMLLDVDVAWEGLWRGSLRGSAE
ncbi:Maf family protein [Acidipropionibacterium virtanenii]|uniref:Nucleoside triphosphate pyrophosphatase n=1 Tax=Acidipropionibacterium virtanenii TaxID=2057246 RepID=A0A344USL3_9ACTN|nr:nucleoside triphosphate pyrophosphatase [Acidipropionibacterium virtanenii]AXE38261.1 Maf-like protein [Acidipropionibacterium virtanenii]